MKNFEKNKTQKHTEKRGVTHKNSIATMHRLLKNIALARLKLTEYNWCQAPNNNANLEINRLVNNEHLI